MALVLDGKIAEATMVVALGITIRDGPRTAGVDPVPPAWSSGAVSQIVDGGKGLRAAVRHAFLVQRCQWHKRETW